MDSFIPRRYFSARPVEAIGVHLKGGIYFFTKDGEYLGEKGLAGFSDKVGDITQIRDTLGNVIDTWDDIFYSSNLKHVIGVSEDRKTIEHYSLSNK
jgi:hypothetical protein